MDSMFYDALGRRVRKQMAAADEYYVYEGAQVIFDLNAAGTVLREYAWYPGAWTSSWPCGPRPRSVIPWRRS
ncbi:MAG: hypothetical protein IPG75_09350 [Gemmatimonadetes bacterium]|nr:hypothetical protein [Gemmatimonadota bacterium]